MRERAAAPTQQWGERGAVSFLVLGHADGAGRETTRPSCDQPARHQPRERLLGGAAKLAAIWGRAVTTIRPLRKDALILTGSDGEIGGNVMERDRPDGHQVDVAGEQKHKRPPPI